MTDRSSVDPLHAALDNGGHPTPALPRSWRVAIAAAIILSALSFLAAVVMFAVVYTEGHIREQQFCAGQVADLEAKASQEKQTSDFLSTQAGQVHTAFNDYIRNVSFPRLQEELGSQQANFPPVCKKYLNK